MSWRPSLGAMVEPGGVRFRLWAPDARQVELVIEAARIGSGPDQRFSLESEGDGYFGSEAISGIGIGDRYRYLVDGRGPFPDPASRHQPLGVHGPSEVVDPKAYAWSDLGWRGTSTRDLVIYELHIGAFTEEGTFRSASEKLPTLAELGVTAIELMPVADFPGARNWGYDGVNLFAPARCYGTPDDLRSFIDRAHQLGLSVLLDLVMNHLGPDGNYLGQFSRYYMSERHRTPWGPAINLDGPESEHVRGFYIECALHWLHEYHLDGFRLDATHNLVDDRPRHFLAEFVAAVRARVSDRPIHIIAEDWRNLAPMVRSQETGGWGLDGVWTDDFHHEIRRFLTGDDEGVFRDFHGSLDDLAQTLERGWLFCGRYSIHREQVRGTDPTGIEPYRFVYYLQNHDRIGNRADGERLHQRVQPAALRAAVALLFAAGGTPLLFMGEEWSASAPFQFFTDHEPALGELVRKGRLREFRHYRAFRDVTEASIPDPQDERTFLRCKLDWSERDREPHAATWRLYQSLLRLRRLEPALRTSACGSVRARAVGDSTLLVRREASDGTAIVAIVCFGDHEQTVRLDERLVPGSEARRSWTPILTTEDAPFAEASSPPSLELACAEPRIVFRGPCAVLLREESLPISASAAPGFEDSRHAV